MADFFKLIGKTIKSITLNPGQGGNLESPGLIRIEFSDGTFVFLSAASWNYGDSYGINIEDTCDDWYRIDDPRVSEFIDFQGH